MLELYHNEMSTCSQKVRFALAEKGLKWTGHHLNLRARDQQRREYIRLNPNAVVPTLVDNGNPVIESTVINEYLDDAYPTCALRPVDPNQCVRMRLWTKQLDEGVHAATGVLSTGIAFRYQKLALPAAELEALIKNVPDPAKRERTRENIMQGVNSRYFVGALKRFDKLVADFETALAEGPWLAGSEFSLADIAYAPYMVRLGHLQLGILWDERSHVAAWFARLKERAGFKSAIVEWLNPSYVMLMEKKGKEVQSRLKALLTEPI
ncbi:MAG: glutathione S-transferase family protein [Candidatus Binatia bacterium]